MKWKDHISLISTKVSRVIGIIKYAKKVLPLNLLKMLYSGLVEPHFKILLLCLGLTWDHYPQNTR